MHERYALTARRATLVVLILLSWAALPGSSSACSPCTPARPVPAALWGELRPVDPDPLPSSQDSTRYNGNQFPGIRLPLFADIDAEGGLLFVVYSSGFQVWGTEPKLFRLSVRDGWEGHFPRWEASGENVEVMLGVDAPAGDPTLAVTVGRSAAGLVVWDTSNPRMPRALYQHHAVLYRSVYAVRISGRDYAFAGGFGGTGLHAYDLTSARSLPSGTCIESGPAEAGRICAGVYLGRIGDATAASWVHGAGNFLVVTSGGVPFGVKLWDVSRPSNARLIVNGLQSLPVTGAALWRNPSTGRDYLATRLVAEARIFDVTQCLAVGCSSFAQNQIWSTRLPSATGEERATLSWSNDIPVIHFGSANNNAGTRRDFLFDVSNPTAPREIIPRNSDGSPKTIAVGGMMVDYWSWYYEGNPQGLSAFEPLVGVFSGRRLYRAARSVLDVHEWAGSGAPSPPLPPPQPPPTPPTPPPTPPPAPCPTCPPPRVCPPRAVCPTCPTCPTCPPAPPCPTPTETVCGPDRLEVCLLDGRFQVRVEWSSGPMVSGLQPAHPVRPQALDHTALWWMIEPSSVDVVVKLIDASPLGVWAFIGGPTSLPYQVTITDTVTGAARVYSKPAGLHAPIVDLTAFPTHGTIRVSM